MAKFVRAMDPRKFLKEATNTQVTPETMVETLEKLKARAHVVDVRRLMGTERNELNFTLSRMEERALDDAIRLGKIRVGMLREKRKRKQETAA